MELPLRPGFLKQKRSRFPKQKSSLRHQMCIRDRQYMEEYVRAFRVFYTAIRSTSSTSRVFFSTDYNWLHEADGRLKYNAKDVLDTFNSMVVPGGPMDWELAYHPYSIPMVEPEFWNDAETGLIKNLSLIHI